MLNYKMTEYYHLRVDCPTYDYLVQHLKKVQDPARKFQYIATLEISDKGKRHFHMIILLDDEDVQPLRQYLGGTYKRNLKKDNPLYWEKTYGDSKKIQVYSLKCVVSHKQCYAYIHKEANTDTVFKSYAPSFEDWEQDMYDECIKIEEEEAKKCDNKEEKQFDDFWEKFNQEHPEWQEGLSSVSGLPLMGDYMYAVQKFYDEFKDIRGFRAKFLRSAFRNRIIDFNTYINKMYRL